MYARAGGVTMARAGCRESGWTSVTALGTALGLLEAELDAVEVGVGGGASLDGHHVAGGRKELGSLGGLVLAGQRHTIVFAVMNDVTVVGDVVGVLIPRVTIQAEAVDVVDVVALHEHVVRAFLDVNALAAVRPGADPHSLGALLCPGR